MGVQDTGLKNETERKQQECTFKSYRENERQSSRKPLSAIRRNTWTKCFYYYWTLTIPQYEKGTFVCKIDNKIELFPLNHIILGRQKYTIPPKNEEKKSFQ